MGKKETGFLAEIAGKVLENGRAQAASLTPKDAESMKTETCTFNLLETVIRELGTSRDAYADLIEEIEKKNHLDKASTEADYQQLMRDWKDGERVGHGARGEFELEFRETILPIWELMGWAKGTLAALSFRSDYARRIYAEVREMTFVKHFEHYIWWSPFGTLRGLDTLIELLQAALGADDRDVISETHGPAASKRRPTMRDTRRETIDKAVTDIAAAAPNNAELNETADRSNRKGDVTLLQDRDGKSKKTVSYEHACSYLGVSRRQVERLAAKGTLR